MTASVVVIDLLLLAAGTGWAGGRWLRAALSAPPPRDPYAGLTPQDRAWVAEQLRLAVIEHTPPPARLELRTPRRPGGTAKAYALRALIHATEVRRPVDVGTFDSPD